MNFREASKANYGGGQAPTIEDINSGSLQRIADAAEKMANSIVALMQERDKLKADLVREQEYGRQSRERRDKQIDELRRQRASLRGVITKLKGKKS